MKKVIIILTAIFSFYMLTLYFTESKETNWHFISGLLQAGIAILGGIAGILGSRKVFGKMKSAILIASFALFAQAISLIFWVYYVINFGIEIPYPSIADWYLALNRILLIIVLIIFIFIYKTNVSKARLFFAIISGFIAGLAIYYFTNSPEIIDKTKNIIQYFTGSLEIVNKTDLETTFLDAFWGVIDVITAGFAVIVLRLTGGRILKGIKILTFGLIAITISDIWFVFRKNSDLYWNGDISDVALIISIAIISCSIISLSSNKKEIFL